MDEDAHDGAAVWSVAVRPDGKGFMTGGADKYVKFWDFTVEDGGMGATLTRQLQMAHEVLCVKYSPTRSQDKLMVAVGLLDATVKLFYDDSLKFFLSLYGHKLPVLSLDISDDCSLLVSGSADKTVKIWGLDFGDCHRSLIAHDDSVTSVRFQPKTHYFFSTGKDGILKYWDADRFEQILFLPGHKSAIWGVAVSWEGSFAVTGGQDRAIRVWERSDDLVFIEEEKERALEAQVDKAVESDSRNEGEEGQADPAAGATAAARTAESVKGGEMLMDALDLVEAELLAIQQHQDHQRAVHKKTLKNMQKAAQKRGLDAEDQSNLPELKLTLPKPSPLLLGATPLKYMLSKLRQVKAPDLEQALLTMTFPSVVRLLSMLSNMLSKGLDVELCGRCSVYIMRCHLSQLAVNPALRSQVEALGETLKGLVGDYRSLLGTNVAAMRFLVQHAESNRKENSFFSAGDANVTSTSGGAGAEAEVTNSLVAKDWSQGTKDGKKRGEKRGLGKASVFGHGVAVSSDRTSKRKKAKS